MHKLFESQRENETVFMVVREHPALITMKLLFIALLFLVSLVAHAGLPYLLGNIFSTTGLAMLSLLFYLFYLALLLSALTVFTLYYLSLQIITDARMVDVDQAAIFKRRVTEILIENIEEVSSGSQGFLATFFNYGNVLVQTSSAQNNFEFANVAHPEEIKKLILDLSEAHQKPSLAQPDEPT